MSHYAVVVIHRDNQFIDDILAPYDENMPVEPYLLVTKEEIMQQAIERRDDAIYDIKHNTAEAINCIWWFDKHISALTDEELYLAEIDYQGYRQLDDDGNAYSDYNPESKWDWWVEGGRFCDFLKLKQHAIDPEYPDCDTTYQALFTDIDFSTDQEVYENALEFWDECVDGTKDGAFYTKDYYKTYYHDRETYARYTAQFGSYAVITPDGVWHAPGNMGWFACSDETPEALRDWNEHYYERFIKPYLEDESMMITVVDCHI